MENCPRLAVGQLKPNPSLSGFAPLPTDTQKMPSSSVPGSAANNRDSLELKIGRCWQQLMLLLTVPNWVGYLQKADGRGGTPAIHYEKAKSPLRPLLWELMISWHLVGKPGTVPCAERNPLKDTEQTRPRERQTWNQMSIVIQISRKKTNKQQNRFCSLEGITLVITPRGDREGKQYYTEGRWFKKGHTSG